MPAKYEWNEWGEADSAVEIETDGRITQKFWFRALIGLLVAAAVVFTVYRILDREAGEISASTEADILATLAIIIDANNRKDTDLAASFISGRDPNWSHEVRSQIENGVLFAVPGMAADDAERGPEISADQVEISPSFNQAKVDIRLDYSRPDRANPEATTSYTRTLLFRRGADRWLLSPPDASVFENRQKLSGAIISMEYPAQEERFATKLFNISEELLNAVCLAELESGCPEDFHIDISLETDLASQNSTPKSAGEDALESPFVLPSLFLSGTPLDAYGLNKLLHYHQEEIVRLAVSMLSGWDCCGQVLFYEALVDKFLSNQGIIEWPLKELDYERMLVELTDVHAQERAWHIKNVGDAEEEMERSAAAIVEFILSHNRDLKPLDLIATLDNEKRYQEWLEHGLDKASSEGRIQGMWMEFLQRRSLSGMIGSDQSLPEQKLNLLCKPASSSHGGLFEYDFSSDKFSLVGDELAFMLALPGGNGVIFERIEDQIRQVYIRRESDLDLVYQTHRENNEGLQYAGSLDPIGERLLMYGFVPTPRTVIRGPSVQYYRLDFGGCQWPDCDLLRLPGPIIWSPDGERSIVQHPRNWAEKTYELVLSDEKGNPLAFIGAGSHPFWLGSSSFGYRNLEGDIVLVDSQEAVVEKLFKKEDFRVVANKSEVSELSIKVAEADQSESGNLAIVVQDIGVFSNQTFIHIYSIESRQIQLLDTFESVNVGRPYFTGGGRWLSIRTYEDLGEGGSEPWSLYLYNLGRGDEPQVFRDSERRRGTEVHPAADWSGNGRWLIRAFEGYLMLTDTSVLVEDGFFLNRIIIPPLPICDNVTWIGPY